MAGVIREAQEQAVTCGTQGTLCSCSFSVAKWCCFTISDSFCHAVSQRWRGTNHLLFQASPETCLSCCCHLAKGVIWAARIPAVRLREGLGREEPCGPWRWWFLHPNISRPWEKLQVCLAAGSTRTNFVWFFCCRAHHGSCRCCKSRSGGVWWGHPEASGALRSVEVLAMTRWWGWRLLWDLISLLVVCVESANR